MKTWQMPWQRNGGLAAMDPTGAGTAALAEQLAADEGTSPHCGWYESSWELQRGLAVTELHGTVRRRPVSEVGGAGLALQRAGAV